LLNDTVDERTDVYGVGTVLYQMLSGRPVVVTESERPDEVVREMLRSNRSLRLQGMDALSGWIEKALAIEPSRRFESAKVAARELAALRSGRSEPPSGVTALSPSSGTTIAERYEVIDEVGRGGMGLVLLAKDIQLERPVAIKMLDDVSPAARERLRLEGRGLGRVVSPQVVHVYDYGEHEGVPFLVMEYIEGEPLEDLLGRSPEGLPLDLLKLVVTEVARGLRAIHDVGMVHGDIKPSNVVLGKDNRVVLLDFGLVRPAVEFGGEAVPIEGSPAYMAPERIEARVDPDSAAQVDAYSFAVMMFELLSGWLPFQSGSVLEMLAHHRVKPPPSVSEHRSDLSHDVDHVLKRGMAKKVADRYPTVEDFAKALVAALNRAPLFDASLLIVSDDASARASLAHLISERLKPRALHESAVGTVGFAAQKSGPNVVLWAGSVNHLLASIPLLQEHCPSAAIVALVDDESEYRERLRKAGVTMLVPRGCGEVLERVLLSAIRQSMRP
jgi:serine/threonine protein kinase